MYLEIKRRTFVPPRKFIKKESIIKIEPGTQGIVLYYILEENNYKN